jgi:hypothetical protein
VITYTREVGLPGADSPSKVAAFEDVDEAVAEEEVRPHGLALEDLV